MVSCLQHFCFLFSTKINHYNIIIIINKAYIFNLKCFIQVIWVHSRMNTFELNSQFSIIWTTLNFGLIETERVPIISNMLKNMRKKLILISWFKAGLYSMINLPSSFFRQIPSSEFTSYIDIKFIFPWLQTIFVNTKETVLIVLPYGDWLWNVDHSCHRYKFQSMRGVWFQIFNILCCY